MQWLIEVSLCCGVILSGVLQVDSWTYENSTDLMDQLLTGYDKRQRPVLNQSKPVQVYVSFELINLQDIDELAGKISIGAYPILVWYDEKLRWVPSEHDGIQSLIFRTEDIWSPVLTLTNPYTSEDNVFASSTVRVFSHGLVAMTSMSVSEASCPIDVKYYPFDTQVCWLSFSPSNYYPIEVSLVPTYNESLTSYFTKSGEWHYKSSTIISLKGQYINSIALGLVFERQSAFLIVNVLLPILLMATMNILVFVIPPDAGERISYSVTVLLALAVYLTIVGDNLPKSSDPMPIFCYYLTAVVVLSVTMCIVTIFNLRVYHKDEATSPPACLQAFANVMLCRWYRNQRRRKSQKYRNDIIEDGRSHQTVYTDEKVGRYVPTRDGMGGTRGGYIEENRSRTMSQPSVSEQSSTKQSKTTVSWKELSFVFDTVCMFVYVVAILVVNMYYVFELQSYVYNEADYILELNPES